MELLAPLPSAFASTREALRALACYVIAPARKAREGRIGLRPTGDGLGTPVLADGSRIVVRGDHLVVEPGPSIRITTLRAAGALVGVALSADPGVGHDLPPYEPDRDLPVDAAASLALGAWYAFGAEVLATLPTLVPDGTVSEAQLWPEHFDLAVTVGLPGGAAVNVGFSPGDGVRADPYAYVGPHDTSRLADDDYWNAPFGALLGYDEIVAADDPVGRANTFVGDGLIRTRAWSPAN